MKSDATFTAQPPNGSRVSRADVWRCAIMAVVLACVAEPGFAAPPKHDLYVGANLAGQSQVMGSKRSVASGLYRSTDRKEFEPVGFGHIRIFTLTHDVREPSTLFLSTLDGVIRAADRGTKWRIVTRWDMTEPKGIAFDPNAPDHIYAGLPDGIAVSRDRGVSWRRMDDGIRRKYTQTITIDRTRAGRVLAGTELGIFLSEDGAATWRRVLETEKTTYDLRQSPHDPAHFFAVTSSDGAFWSADRGAGWRRIEGVPVEHTLHACDFDSHDARRLLVCGWGAGVRISEDGGRTWQDRTAGLPNRDIWRAAFDPDTPGRVYAAPFLQPLFVSDDDGRNWRPLAFEKAIVYDMVFVPRS